MKRRVAFIGHRKSILFLTFLLLFVNKSIKTLLINKKTNLKSSFFLLNNYNLPKNLFILKLFNKF